MSRKRRGSPNGKPAPTNLKGGEISPKDANLEESVDRAGDGAEKAAPPRKTASKEGRMEPMSPRPYLKEIDFTDVVYSPHTLMALVVFISFVLLMVRYYYYPDMSVVASVKLGLAASAFSFLVFGVIHLPDSLLVRPHPFVWRGVLALAVLYVALLSFLLFQNLTTVRAIMGLYDPALLEALPEGQYAVDCRISTPSKPYLFFHTAFDVFIIAHALGYFVKTLILRDWRLATCVSVGFEILEVTFQHVLPNFKECWWDHLLLDVLLCNGGGTLLGMFMLRRLRAKKYHWVALRNIKGYKGKTQRILGQFGPRSFVSYEWDVFHDPKRFVQFLMVLLFMFLEELNCFTMKHILQMPPKYHLVTLRLALWSLMAMPSIREIYAYINATDTKMARLGATAWVSISALLLETIWIAKLAMEGGYFYQPMPTHIAVPWMCAIFLFAVWFALFFGVLSLRQRRERRGVWYAVSNLFFYAGCGCVVAMFLMGMPDLRLGRESFERLMAPYEAWIFFWRR
ncbi:phosphatidyl serine synthase [Trypanosoma conorhini]|uniref:Phosphatidyl serine synthase n=1 Tax=Trypanosoma conorhini TaxID=83891 RepID=A0A422PX98_9TRYP|nr:phosphatidyl serine synthase [Trypanosoma conorhini]RNF22363.1 phosphatidyl serine synthase [Trypanosoma conorhini]